MNWFALRPTWSLCQTGDGRGRTHSILGRGQRDDSSSGSAPIASLRTSARQVMVFGSRSTRTLGCRSMSIARKTILNGSRAKVLALSKCPHFRMRGLPLPTPIRLTAVVKDPTLEQRAAVLATHTTTDAVRLDQLPDLIEGVAIDGRLVLGGKRRTVMVEGPLHTILADFKTFCPKPRARPPQASATKSRPDRDSAAENCRYSYRKSRTAVSSSTACGMPCCAERVRSSALCVA